MEAWGSAGDSEGISLSRNLGDGVTLDYDQGVIRAVLESDEVKAHLWRCADALAAEANALAAHVGRPDEPEPHYAGVGDQVHPVNYQAMVDEAMHSTLLKVIAAHQD
jgi:hypothetical protein